MSSRSFNVFSVTSVFSLAVSFACGQVNYYRFEEGVADMPAVGSGIIIDSVDGSHDGTPEGGPMYRASVPFAFVPQTGQSDGLSLSFAGAQGVHFLAPFIFHRGFGDATLEFFINVPDQGHHAIFWTRPDDADLNRFNIAINPNGGFGFDYRAPNGTLHLQAGEPLFNIPLNSWHHVAVTRDVVSAAPSHVYRFYLDGAFQTMRTDAAPELPDANLVWAVSGRTSFRLVGLLDEIRLTDRILDPGEFLNATPACSRGDMNCDGRIDGTDVQTFVETLWGGAACTPNGGDLDGDGIVSPADVPGFVACLLVA